MTWRLSVQLPVDLLPPFETALAEQAMAVSVFEADCHGEWRLEALFADKAAAAHGQSLIDAAARASGIGAPRAQIAPLPNRDWVAESLKGLPPVVAGRFHLHGSHDRGNPAPGAWPVRIDAGLAFGTGHHETTKGCLLLLDDLARRWRPRRPLDLGCGSGVLAIAMARAWRVPVLACDIDPIAVATTRVNARVNGVGAAVRGVVADGLDHRAIHAAGPYDLVVGNILARPLQRLAWAVHCRTRPGARVVLSGLLKRQERQVLNTYRSLGFRLLRRVTLGDWPTLLLQRDPSARTRY